MTDLETENPGCSYGATDTPRCAVPGVSITAVEADPFPAIAGRASRVLPGRTTLTRAMAVILPLSFRFASLTTWMLGRVQEPTRTLNTDVWRPPARRAPI